MRICKQCGGFFDDTILICPICGYDFSSALREIKRNKRIARMQKASKYTLYTSLVLTIILCLLIVVFSGAFSGSSGFQDRFDYVFAKTGRFFSEYNSFQQRIGNIGSVLKTINSRFQDVYIKKSETKMRLSSLRENASIVENRLAVFHIDLDQITRRWLFAVNQSKLHYNSIRTISD